MLTYGISTSANDILGCSLTPANYCICKKTAIANHAQETPLQPFDQNRLVPVKVAGMTYGVARKHHVVLQYEDGTTIPGYDLWLEDGAPIPDPAHPEKQGCTPDGWDPAKPATATGDGVYRQKYSTNSYVITFIGKDGQILQQNSYTYGQAIVAPDPQTPSGWAFDGWNPAVPATATANGTYYGQYHEDTPTPSGEGDQPEDDQGNKDVVWTMDNMGLTADYTMAHPTTSIGDPTRETEASGIPNYYKYWSPQEGEYVGQGWWHGPYDGYDGEDPHGANNGIRPRRNGADLEYGDYFFLDSDSCIYEYVDTSDLEVDQLVSSDFTKEEIDQVFGGLLSEWTSPEGKFHIKSNDSWIKFVVGWNSTTIPEGCHPKIYIHYFVQRNENNAPRRGTVTTTTQGGVCHHNAYGTSYGKNYMTHGNTYFYQLGYNERS